MFITILQHIPLWVLLIFGALVVLGVQQAFARSVPLRRLVVLPAVLVALSLAGVVLAFGAAPPPLLAWAAGMALGAVAARLAVNTEAVRFDGATRRLHVPGSWWPLALMMGLFALKFLAGMKLALQPEFRGVAAFALPVSAVYGVFSGAFFGRAMGFVSVVRSSVSVDSSSVCAPASAHR